jgi:glutamine amidotransferase
MTALKAVGGDEIIQERVTAGRPLLGICVGHQILFSSGVEHGINTEGVGIYPGSVQALPTTRVPHMGWNQVVPEPGSQFLTRTQMFYFVHSYAAMNRDDLDDEAVVMWANHEGVDLIAAVEYGPVLSTQFHPEKSAQPGLALIRRWVDHLGVS